ncbi:DUF1045 domain-containing protein [uncultured Roseibium sp.]|uniref:DUF1045 domain-containing protein n=1 Tax=uncultured Roseibium sp. TaxID=1936171 RepID=UPI0026159332|nr:DUF1045 domain-containing protein [uncultured Roseibium sp.]
MRYALYFAADADDLLMQLGNTWLGRDPFTGTSLTQPDVAGVDPERLHALTDSPRRYGFHGTLKAPFHLRSNVTETDLVQACGDFAQTASPFEVRSFTVNPLGKFLALTPNADEPELAAFASACVRRFENFRAPLSQADIERRRKSGLTARQDGYLTEWGYPYIFDEFRFHMTLSNKLENAEEADRMKAAAERHFAEVTGRPHICRSFALYVEPERGAPFDVHTVFQLTGTQREGPAGDHADRPAAEENA